MTKKGDKWTFTVWAKNSVHRTMPLAKMEESRFEEQIINRRMRSQQDNGFVEERLDWYCNMTNRVYNENFGKNVAQKLLSIFR